MNLGDQYDEERLRNGYTVPEWTPRGPVPFPREIERRREWPIAGWLLLLWLFMAFLAAIVLLVLIQQRGK